MPPAAKPSGVVTIATAATFDRGARIGAPTKLIPPDLLNGVAPGDPATIELFNYLHNLAGQWQEYLRDFEDRGHDWGVTQSTGEGGPGAVQRFFDRVVLGSGLLDALSQELPRAEYVRCLHSVKRRVKIKRISKGSGNAPFVESGPAIDIWSYSGADTDHAYEITLNAHWVENAEPNGWSKHVNGQPAVMLKLNTLDVRNFRVLLKQFDQNGAWSDAENDDAGWTRTICSFGASERKLVNGWALDATDTNWELRAIGRPYQKAVAGAGLIYLPLDGILPPWPVKVTQLRLRISPLSGGSHNGNTPGIMPKFTVRKDEGTAVGFGDITDPSATEVAYETPHDIDTDAGGSGFAPFVTDPLSNYYLQFSGEAGSDAAAGLIVNHLKVNYE